MGCDRKLDFGGTYEFSIVVVYGFDLFFQNLKRLYRRTELKCGEDDSGRSIRMKFKHFAKYMKYQTDDSPLYIFDSSFEDREDTKALKHEYRVPKYFPHDLFELVGERKRPPLSLVPRRAEALRDRGSHRSVRYECLEYVVVRAQTLGLVSPDDAQMGCQRQKIHSCGRR